MHKHVAHNMKKTLKTTFTLGFLLIGITVFGQDFGFDIHNISLNKYVQMEENLKSERIPTTSNHVSFSGDAQPIKFKRTEKKIADLITYYYFKEKDSTMSSVLYEWDVSNFEKKDNNQKPKKYQKAFISKYKGLKEKISSEFGEPKTKRNYSNISQLDSINTFVESSTWKPNDSTEIEMYATVSNYYEKKGAMTINPVHRIRLYIKNQSKEKEKEIPKLDENKLSELENIKIDFFKVLKSKDLTKSKEYLSDIIKEKVTDEQLTLLIENIDFERKTELIYSGIQMGFNGSMFTLLQYKYSDDSSSPPNEMIKLIFDDKDKVVGIQPIKMQGKIKE
jgi:hypothetical protein